MGRSTGAAVALVVGAVEILDLRIALIEMKVKVAAAISADQQAGKHIVILFQQEFHQLFCFLAL